MTSPIQKISKERALLIGKLLMHAKYLQQESHRVAGAVSKLINHDNTTCNLSVMEYCQNSPGYEDVSDILKLNNILIEK